MEYGCWKKIEKGVVALSIRATKCFVFYNFELSHIATIQKYWFQTFKIFLNFKASYNQTFTYIKKVYFCHMPEAKNSTKGKLGKISFQNKHYINLAIQLGFTPCKAEQPLRGIELQEKKHKKDYRLQKICLERAYSQKMSVNSGLKTT